MSHYEVDDQLPSGSDLLLLRGSIQEREGASAVVRLLDGALIASRSHSSHVLHT